MKRKIKRILFLALAVATLTVFFVFSASAKEYSSGDFKYNVGSKNAVLLSYTGKDKDVKIPSKVKGVPVTSIADWAFDEVKTMETISIPSTVTKIGEASFNACSSLRRVNLPKNLKKISASAFWYCTGLKQVFIYDKVTSIGKNAFKGCDNATIYVVKGSYAEKHVKTLDNVKMKYRYMTSLKLTETSLSLELGSTTKLSYKYSPSAIYNKNVKFKSSDEKILKVTEKGTIKGISCGTATVTCTANDGSGKTATCTVKVVPANVKNVKTYSVKKDSFKLKWDKAKGATSYLIKKYDTKDKKWVTFLKTSKTACSVTNLEPGTSVRFAIKAYTKVGSTTYYSPAYTHYTGKTSSPDKVTGLTAKAGSDNIRLSWNKIEGATGYLVYIYDSEAKEYYQKADVTSASAEITGLKSNTTYSFAVKAYFRNSEGTAYSKYYSEVCMATTLPGVVTGFSVLSDYTTTDSITLTWTGIKDCSGYIIYIYDSKTTNFIPYHTIKSDAITMYQVTGLEEDTSYQFKIRAYSGIESNAGELSSKLTVKTAKKLLDESNGFEFFVNALNTAKNNTNRSFSIRKQCNVTNRVAPGSIEYTAILSDVARSYSETYSIVGGKDSNTQLEATSIIAPLNKDCTLDKSMIDESSLKVTPNGNGYTVFFSLQREGKDGEVHSLITEPIDWTAIEEKYEGFELNYCIYDNTTVEAKVRENQVDHLMVKIPMDVSFSYNGKDYSFSQTVEYKYFFIWN